MKKIIEHAKAGRGEMPLITASQPKNIKDDVSMNRNTIAYIMISPFLLLSIVEMRLSNLSVKKLLELIE